MEDFKPKVFISYTWSNNDYIAKVTQYKCQYKLDKKKQALF